MSAPLAPRITRFQETLPHRDSPYASRSWGHNLHSLCSYQGKLKPSLAHWLVESFTQPGDRVLDPLAGVGTIPFEASMLGRVGIANDLSPLAATVSRAKLRPLHLGDIDDAIETLEQDMGAISLTADDYDAASFGLNSAVSDYYHPDTLAEVLKARRVFLSDLADGGDRRPFVWASLLHILHGNRPYALSRTSHPITPFSPTGPAVYKSLTGKLRERMMRALRDPLPEVFKRGDGYWGDFRDLPSAFEQPVDAIITSPPFLGMRFDRPNWLRLWFCGWSADDFHIRSLGFLEREQTKSFDCYEDFFVMCQRVLAPTGLVIVHVGAGGKDELLDGLRRIGQDYFTFAGEVAENVVDLEQHGLKDKGRRTTAHHLLFFRPS